MVDIYQQGADAWWEVVPWYGLMTVIGTIAALIFIYYRWREKQYSKFHFWTLSIFTLLFALFGARWWYLMWNPSHYESMIDLFQINEGRAIQGAIFFGGLFIWVYTRWIAPQLEFRKVASLIVPHVLLAQAIGRWGNFFNQEVYGDIVTYEQIQYLPQFIIDGMLITDANGVTAYRNPLFLWESIANFVGWILLGFALYDRKWLKEGAMIGLYMMWYNVTRAIMEPMRDPTFVMNINGVPTSFIISIVFASTGLFTFIWYQFGLFEKAMAWSEYKQDALVKKWVSEIKLTYLFITRQIRKQEFTTLVGVSKNRYNKYIESLDPEEIEKYKEGINNG